ncbi:hypothetical protein DY000_02061024 [Brassica cretica]|uniref:DUF4283 domain-containing protein n=1 Tax=Brassica cretica TaxID=69181 RepID=A0ABQ7B074_BRACR|nr:hypothetical protein DY000_02061024 [Brassica cretica]
MVKKKKPKRRVPAFPPSSKFARIVLASSSTTAAKAKAASCVTPPDPSGSTSTASPDPVEAAHSPTDVVNVQSPSIDSPRGNIVTVEGSSSGSDASPEDKSSLSPGTEKQTSIPTLAKLIQKSGKLEELGTPSQHISGVPFVLISDDNLEEAKLEFQDFLFARFQGDIPSKGKIIGVVNAIWARAGPRIFVHQVGHGSFLLKVTSPRTREILLSRSAWMIAGSPMFITAWSPEFAPEDPPLSTAVVPVELRGVPYLLFNQQCLSRLSTAIGKPLSLFPKTERKENFEVAKVWVQVSLLEELPSKIITGFSNGREVEITVSYPWLPQDPPLSAMASIDKQLIEAPVEIMEIMPHPTEDQDQSPTLQTGKREILPHTNDDQGPPPPPTVSLVIGQGFSTAIVHHDSARANNSTAGGSHDQSLFYLVSNRKSGRKAARA